MKNYKINKLLCFVIILALVFGNCITIYAADSNAHSSEKIVVIYDDGETQIDSYEDIFGNTILRQYQNGTLVKRDTINPNNPEIIECEYFSNGTTRAVSYDTINIRDYGVLEKSAPEIQTYSTRTLAGTIKYSASIDTGIIYYGLKCTYVTVEVGASTYTIDAYKGYIVDLVAILVGALSLPVEFATAYVRALIVGLGATVSGGIIKSAITDTVSCNETDYKWTLTDTTDSGHSKHVVGYKYFVTDTKSAAQNKTYYEGYTPNDWGKHELAVWFHNEMFAYSAWSVIGWS